MATTTRLLHLGLLNGCWLAWSGMTSLFALNDASAEFGQDRLAMSTPSALSVNVY